MRKSMICVALLCACSLLLCGSGFSKTEPILKLYEGSAVSEYKDSEVVELSLADGLVKYRVPKDWISVQNDEALNLDAGRGHGYFLNVLKNKKSAEYLAVFYFSNKKYLANTSDVDEKGGVERAIICNVCPKETSNLKWWNPNLKHYTFPTAVTEAYGRQYDYYTTNYDSHRVEFVFTPARDGMCVVLYVYNEDSSSVKDIKYVLKSLEIAK